VFKLSLQALRSQELFRGAINSLGSLIEQCRSWLTWAGSYRVLRTTEFVVQAICASHRDLFDVEVGSLCKKRGYVRTVVNVYSTMILIT
jgi:hypothetical protein